MSWRNPLFQAYVIIGTAIVWAWSSSDMVLIPVSALLVADLIESARGR